MIARYRARAERDIEDIHAWLRQKSESWAHRVVREIRTQVELLAEHPGLGVATDDVPARRWPMPRYGYAVFYEIDWANEQIEVLRVRDSRRLENVRRVPE